MARDLYDHEPSFRDDLDRCDQLFRDLTGGSLLGIMFAAQDETAINETRFAQPALLALEVSLARLWRRWGIVPHAVCGHDVGELAAACDAGMITLEDAMRLAAFALRDAASLNVGEGRALLVSGLTGHVARAGDLADPRYWARQARDGVRFADAIRTLQEAGCDTFVEIGPQPQLTSLAGSVVEGTAKLHVLPSLERGRDSRLVMRESVARLYARGAALDWKAFNRGAGQRISLPPSPFIRESYWAYESLRNEAAPPHPATS